MEDDLGEGVEGDGHVDGAGGLAVDGELGEDVARGLVEDGRLLVATDGGTSEAGYQVDSVMSSPELAPPLDETMRS